MKEYQRKEKIIKLNDKDEKYSLVENNVQYYSNSRSIYPKIGIFTFGEGIITSFRDIHINCRQFATLTHENGWIDGQVIDVYVACKQKYWPKYITYIPTDNTKIILEDFSSKRKDIIHPFYKINKPLKDIVFISYNIICPYVFQGHWRLLIVNIKMKNITLLDPYRESTDEKRVTKVFYKFIEV